jgi:tRNA(Ile2) C34 agmatinyltransferase TiaS
MQIDITMRVRMDATKRPVCLDCNHSVMSHGEKDGKLQCWPCLAIGKKCEPKEAS